MAAERLSVRKIKEALRLHWAGRTNREIGRNLAVSHTTIGEYLRRAKLVRLSWPLPPDLTDGALEAQLFPPTAPSAVARPLPAWNEVERELRRKGVTLQLLWYEYKEAQPEGLQYSQFCDHFRAWKSSLDLVLRQQHKAGEKVFVDYAGQTVPIVDRASGEVREAQIFVGVLGASNFTYAEASWTQTLPDWIGAHVRMYEYFGGVPVLTVPDNLKAGVRHPCYYDPDVNATYQELASHYGTTVLPTRVRRPRDKAKAEAGVLLVERWILARLRNHTFFSLAELNGEIRRLLDYLNERPFQKLDGCRRSLLEEVERPALLPLPATRYEFAQWKKARVNIDYHVEVDGHYYSVPYTLVRKQVHVRLTSSAIEILHESKRVATHVRSHKRGGFTTDPGHRPKAHEKHLEWTPSRILRWAAETGPSTAALAQRILEDKPHPEQGYRGCLGLLRLGERHGGDRLEAACFRALRIGGTSYRSVKSILKNGLDRLPVEEQTSLLPEAHENVRGPDYYAEVSVGGGPC